MNLNNWFKKVESTIGPLAKVFIGVSLISALGWLSYLNVKQESDITSSTVMITTMSGNGGGSGSVVLSEANRSLVLTNRHVCQIARNGAVIKTNDGKSHLVTSYQESETHDLCLIKVSAKLSGKVWLAKKAPNMFEKATVSGHPNLLPNVVTEGHFSGTKIIDVFLGMRECTVEEERDPDIGLICSFFGQLPKIKTYETVLVTATIMPGSSGSAVYNSSKELSAVVFAGSGDIGYAFTVPFEYVDSFLKEEINRLPNLIPNYNLNIIDLIKQQDHLKKKIKHIETKCSNDINDVTDINQRMKLERMCNVILRDFNWRVK